MIRIHSISLGCPKNRVDTEQALGGLNSLASLETVDSPRKADLVFINTCAFIAPAVEESVRVLLECIKELRALPRKRRPLLAAAGCLVGRYGARVLAPDLPEVDIWLDNRERENWPLTMVRALVQAGTRARTQDPAQSGTAARAQGQALAGTFEEADQSPDSSPETDQGARPAPARLLSTGPAYAWLKISDGCRHACSFCTIPQIRGPLRSAPARQLLDEAQALLALGVKELVVVAQDSTAFGADLGLKHGLKSLLEELLPLQGLERLRLMYLYPAGLSRNLLAFLKAAGPPFVPYFDVPLQHASGPVLRAMGRPFSGRPAAVVERIRDFFPEAALRSSLITGFPGEKAVHFASLRRFVAASRFMHLGVFAYQPEEGTLAANLPDQVAPGEREARRDEIMALQAEISEELLAGFVGGRERILVEAEQGEWPGLHVGRAWFQAPECDGITYVSGPGVKPGALVEADIVESSVYDLTALSDAAGPEDL